MQDYLEFSGYRIDYVVKKEKRRSYRLKIDRESRLIVYVPVRATNADIERVILSKKNWISKHITHRQSLNPDYA